MARTGRPPSYTKAKADAICFEISTTSKSILSICKELNIGYRTVMRWISENEEFRQAYARAKEDQADVLAEEIISIADESHSDLLAVDEWGNRIENKEFVNRSRLRIDARKWVAAKLKPKKYSDKVDVNHSGGITNTNITVTPEEAKQIAKYLEDKI